MPANNWPLPIGLSLLMLFFVTAGYSQTFLSFADVKAKIIANNKAIKQAAALAEVAKKQAHPGYAGLLPTLNLNAGADYRVNDVFIEFFGGQPSVERRGAVNTVNNTGLTANYTVFNGLNNVYTYKRLKAEAIQAEQNLFNIERNLIESALEIYGQLAKQHEQLKALKFKNRLSAYRLNRLRSNLSMGQGRSLDTLNARVDYNLDSLNVLSLQMGINSLTNSLANLMGEDNSFSFIPLISGGLNIDIKADSLTFIIEANHPEYRVAKQQLIASDYDLRAINGSLMPTLNFTAGYAYSQSINQAGIFRSNTNIGFNTGLTLNWALYDGRRRRNNVLIASSRKKAFEYQLENLKANLVTNAVNLLNEFEIKRQIYQLQQSSVDVAEKNLEVAQQLYDFAQIDGLRFREAQNNQFQARVQLTNSQVDVWLATEKLSIALGIYK